jgi:hypothetical protein
VRFDAHEQKCSCHGVSGSFLTACSIYRGFGRPLAVRFALFV